MKLIDIGVNLTGSSFRRDLNEVIARAGQAGVEQMIVTGTNLEHSRAAVEMVGRYPGVLFSTAGLHPHHASECDEPALAEVRRLAQEDTVVAIGECGLDFNRNYSPQDAQIRCFEAQLELAAELQLPVFLHQRDAHDTFVAILKNWRDKLCGGVAHCFTGTEQEAKDYMDLDLHIGVTGWICDERRGHDLQQAVKSIPEDRLMIETDAPYLLPRDLQPRPKDRRNEPMFLPHICRAVAHYRGEDEEETASVTTGNTLKFFDLSSKQ